MTGPVLAAKFRSDFFHLNEGELLPRIHFFVFRQKKIIYPSFFRKFLISSQIPGIILKILFRPELKRIYIKTYHDDITFLPRSAHQTQVALMEMAHAWHQSNSFPG